MIQSLGEARSGLHDRALIGVDEDRPDLRPRSVDVKGTMRDQTEALTEATLGQTAAELVAAVGVDESLGGSAKSVDAGRGDLGQLFRVDGQNDHSGHNEQTPAGHEM